jgi:hypothetical protein
MSYSTGEDLLFEVIKDLPSFDQKNVRQSDWKNLGADNDHYAVLRPGEFEEEWIAPTTVIYNWVTVIELWQKFTDDIESKTNLFTYAKELMDGIVKYRLLGDSTGAVQDSNLRGGDDPLEMADEETGKVAWLRWDLILEWKEEASVTFSE